MLIKPRYYQQEAIGALATYLDEREGNPLIAMPTGTGKSVVLAGACEQFISNYSEMRIHVVTHVQELVEQNHGKMIDLWPLAPAGICSSGLDRFDTKHQITFGGIQTMYRRADEFGEVHLVLVDEVQTVGPRDESMYGKYFGGLRKNNPKLRIGGLSATIFRPGLGLLTNGELFDDVCYDITGCNAFNKLVAEGYLAPLVSRPTNTQYDFSQVRSIGDDYNQGDLQRAMDLPGKTKEAVLEIMRMGQDRRSWLIFASGVEHAKHVAAMLNTFGIPTGCVHKDLDRDRRRLELQRFKNGTYRAMVNNNILTTGFDDPKIDLIGILRKTKSAVLHVQMLGRGTRPWPGKTDCLVLDFVGNVDALGPINDPVIPRPKGKRQGPPTPAPIRVCDGCGNHVHTAVRICPYCETEQPYATPGTNVNASASASTPMRGDIGPLGIEIQPFQVDRVSYSEHEPRNGGVSSMCVVYYCGFRRFREWVCFGHKGSARGLAVKWWRARMRVLHDVDARLARGEEVEIEDPPHSVAEVVQFAHLLPIPKSINVWYNKKPYPEVMSHEF